MSTIEKARARSAKMFGWVASDHPSVNTISIALYTASETVVVSGAMTNSGFGGYGGVIIMPSTMGNYRVEVTAWIGTDITGAAAPYLFDQALLVTLEGVD